MKTENKIAIARTSKGLRDVLFDELESLRAGGSNPTQANAVAKLAGSVVETVKMEIEAQKFIASISTKTPDAEIASLELGTPS